MRKGRFEEFISYPEIDGYNFTYQMSNIIRSNFCDDCWKIIAKCRCSCHERYYDYDSDSSVEKSDDYDASFCACCIEVNSCDCRSKCNGSRLVIYQNYENENNFHIILEIVTEKQDIDKFCEFGSDVKIIDITLDDKKSKTTYTDILDESLFDFMNKFQENFENRVRKIPIVKVSGIEDIDSYSREIMDQITKMTNKKTHQIVSRIFQVLIQNQCSFLKREISERLETLSKKTNPHLKKR